MAVVASVGTLHAIVRHQKDNIDLWFMKFFRDLGRYKALQRRFSNGDTGSSSSSKGLLAFLASEEDPLRDLLALDAENEEELHLPTFSKQELWTMGNHESDDGGLLLGILGRVYDVTEGDKFYGETGNYGHFAGHDVTYALATGCKRLECVETDWTKLSSSLEEDSGKTKSAAAKVFSDEELLEAKKWLSFFHLHDKYPLVGKLEGESFEDLVQQLLEEDDHNDSHTDQETHGAVSEEAMLDGMKR